MDIKETATTNLKNTFEYLKDGMNHLQDAVEENDINTAYKILCTMKQEIDAQIPIIDNDRCLLNRQAMDDFLMDVHKFIVKNS